MNRSTLNVGLSNLKKWKEEKNALRYDLSFQRHTGMWSLPAKSMLIWSILSDSYVPPVIFVKNDEDVVDEKGKTMSCYSVLDGAQRTIARSCIYSSICVVGNKKNIQRIVDSLEEVRNVMVEISSRISTGDFPMSEDDFEVMAKRYLALCSAIVNIADGASYLFGVDNPKPSSVFEKQEHLKQLLESIDIKP